MSWSGNKTFTPAFDPTRIFPSESSNNQVAKEFEIEVLSFKILLKIITEQLLLFPKRFPIHRQQKDGACSRQSTGKRATHYGPDSDTS